VTYRQWQRQHLDWPPRMKDLVIDKCRVKLLHGTITRSGKQHSGGGTYVVVGVYRGHLHLEGPAGGLRHVHRNAVVLADELLLFQIPLSPLKTRLLDKKEKKL